MGDVTAYGAWTLWLIAAVAGVCTFAIRFSFVYLFGRVDEVPPALRRTLRFVPAAVFAALVAPALLGGAATGDLDPDRLLAGAVAAAVAWRTESVTATIVVGMVLLWTLRFLV